MSFEYEDLTAADRLAIVTGRLRELESEHFSNALMRRSIEQAPDVDESGRDALLAETDQKLATLERAIAVHREEKARLATAAADDA